jgi:beta-lactamase superfamily II metal-dependent hydrolase
MNVTKYEIDMLGVGAADAFFIHFYDENETQYVVLVDAGYYDNGKDICDFVVNRYGTRTIDLAICTHCDDDHFGGFIYILQEMLDNPKSVDIKKIIVNDPGSCITEKDVKRYEIRENVIKEARSVYNSQDENLLELIEKVKKDCGLVSEQGLSDGHNCEFDGLIDIIAPSSSYYRKQALLFRNKLKPYDYVLKEDEDDAMELPETKKVYSKKLIGTDPSSHNKSSIMFLFKPNDGRKFLFTGDADGDAFDNIAYKSDIEQIKNVYWLKLPHHGSAYNVTNEMVNHLKPKIAYVSTEKYGHYLDRAVVGAFKKAGTEIYSTHSTCNVWYHCNTEARTDYSPADPI